MPGGQRLKIWRGWPVKITRSVGCLPYWPGPRLRLAPDSRYLARQGVTANFAAWARKLLEKTSTKRRRFSSTRHELLRNESMTRK